MAKRFTDTDKWKRPWFANLPNEAKLVWIYLLDECDHRGVWYAHFKRLCSDLNMSVGQENFEAWFTTKIVKLEDDKYFIPSFLEYQYGGELNAENKAHKGILLFLNKFGLEKQGASKPLDSPLQGAKEKEKDKEYNIYTNTNEKKSAGPIPELGGEDILNDALANVSADAQLTWLEVYGDTNWIKGQLFSAAAWLTENPKKAKKDMSRFLGNWLRRSWEKKQDTATKPKRQLVMGF